MSDANDSKLLLEIHADVQVIKSKLERDYSALYGNGHPGLIDEVASIRQDISIYKNRKPSLIEDVDRLKTDLAVMQAKSSWFGTAIAGWLSVIAYLITLGLSLASFFLK